MRLEPKERETQESRSKARRAGDKIRGIRAEARRGLRAELAGMALRMMLWAGQTKGILGGWRIICLVVSLFLQHPGVNSKCYFQAQGKED